MAICVKCGEFIPEDDRMIIWDHCGGIRYICPECNAEEEDYYEEDDEDKDIFTEDN